MWAAAGAWIAKNFLVPLAASLLPKIIDWAQTLIYKAIQSMKEKQAAAEYDKVMDAIERGDTREANKLIKSPNADRPSGSDGMQIGQGEGDGGLVYRGPKPEIQKP